MRWKLMESAPKGEHILISVWLEHYNGAPPVEWTNISWYGNAWRRPNLSWIYPCPENMYGKELPGIPTHWRWPVESPEAEASRLFAGRTLAQWQEFAKTDNCLDQMVPSDLRAILNGIENK